MQPDQPKDSRPFTPFSVTNANTAPPSAGLTPAYTTPNSPPLHPPSATEGGQGRPTMPPLSFSSNNGSNNNNNGAFPSSSSAAPAAETDSGVEYNPESPTQANLRILQQQQSGMIGSDTDAPLPPEGNPEDDDVPSERDLTDIDAYTLDSEDSALIPAAQILSRFKPPMSTAQQIKHFFVHFFEHLIEFAFQFIKWVPPRYQVRKWILQDIAGGVVMSVMLLPMGLAYARLMGVAPILGVYSSAWYSLIYAIVGNTAKLSMGPAAETTLMLMDAPGLPASTLGKATVVDNMTSTAAAVAAATTGSAGSTTTTSAADVLGGATTTSAAAAAAAAANPAPLADPRVNWIILVTLQVGLFTLLYTVFRGGTVIRNSLSRTVAKAYATAAGVLLVLTQIKSMFNLTGRSTVVAWDTVIVVAQSCSEQCSLRSLFSFLWFLVFLGYLMLQPRVWKSCPAWVPHQLIVVVFAIVITLVLDLHGSEGLAILGDIQPLPISIGLPTFDWSDFVVLLPYSGLFAVVSFLQMYGIASNLNPDVDANQELFSQGACATLTSLLGGFAGCSSFSRCSVLDILGVHTPLCSLVAALLLVFYVEVLVAAGVFYYMPNVVLTAIIVSAVSKLIDFSALPMLWGVSKPDFVVWVVTFLGVTNFGVTIGISAGIGLSILIVLWRVSAPEGDVVAYDARSGTYRSTHGDNELLVSPNLLVYEYGHPLYFINVNNLRTSLEELVEREHRPIQFLVLDMSHSPGTDASAADTFNTQVKSFQENRKIELIVVLGTMSEVRDMFSALPSLNFAIYDSVLAAVAYCNAQTKSVLPPTLRRVPRIVFEVEPADPTKLTTTLIAPAQTSPADKRVLCGTIALISHGYRTPKQKLKAEFASTDMSDILFGWPAKRDANEFKIKDFGDSRLEKVQDALQVGDRRTRMMGEGQKRKQMAQQQQQQQQQQQERDGSKTPNTTMNSPSGSSNNMNKDSAAATAPPSLTASTSTASASRGTFDAGPSPLGPSALGGQQKPSKPWAEKKLDTEQRLLRHKVSSLAYAAFSTQGTFEIRVRGYDYDHEAEQFERVQVQVKWGGNLTELGYSHSSALGSALPHRLDLPQAINDWRVLRRMWEASEANRRAEEARRQEQQRVEKLREQQQQSQLHALSHSQQNPQQHHRSGLPLAKSQSAGADSVMTPQSPSNLGASAGNIFPSEPSASGGIPPRSPRLNTATNSPLAPPPLPIGADGRPVQVKEWIGSFKNAFVKVSSCTASEERVFDTCNAVTWAVLDKLRCVPLGTSQQKQRDGDGEGNNTDLCCEGGSVPMPSAYPPAAGSSNSSTPARPGKNGAAAAVSSSPAGSPPGVSAGSTAEAASRAPFRVEINDEILIDIPKKSIYVMENHQLEVEKILHREGNMDLVRHYTGLYSLLNNHGTPYNAVRIVVALTQQFVRDIDDAIRDPNQNTRVVLTSHETLHMLQMRYRILLLQLLPRVEELPPSLAAIALQQQQADLAMRSTTAGARSASYTFGATTGSYFSGASDSQQQDSPTSPENKGPSFKCTKQTRFFKADRLRDLYDNIAYDAAHNFDGLKELTSINIRQLAGLLGRLYRVLAAGQFGLTDSEKRMTSALSIVPLWRRIQQEIRNCVFNFGTDPMNNLIFPLKLMFCASTQVAAFRNTMAYTKGTGPRTTDAAAVNRGGELELSEMAERGWHFMAHFVFRVFRIFPGDDASSSSSTRTPPTTAAAASAHTPNVDSHANPTSKNDSGHNSRTATPSMPNNNDTVSAAAAASYSGLAMTLNGTPMLPPGVSAFPQQSANSNNDLSQFHQRQPTPPVPGGSTPTAKDVHYEVEVYASSGVPLAGGWLEKSTSMTMRDSAIVGPLVRVAVFSSSDFDDFIREMERQGDLCMESLGKKKH